ncbi:hypothetical protein AVEN_185687-1, partial [Araneus ventricosus]
MRNRRRGEKQLDLLLRRKLATDEAEESTIIPEPMKRNETREEWMSTSA